MFTSNFLYVFAQLSVLILYALWLFEIFKMDANSNSCHVSVKKIKKQPWLFFTLWNLAIQLVFLTHNLLEELIFKIFSSSRDFRTRSEKVKHFYFATILCPLTLMVFMFFWPIFLYDRNVIYPKTVEASFPFFSNYTVHLVILIPPILEFFKNADKILRNFEFSLAPFFVEFAYLLTLYSHYFASGEWPYAFIKMISWPSKILFTVLFFSIKYSWFQLLCYFKRRAELKKTN